MKLYERGYDDGFEVGYEAGLADARKKRRGLGNPPPPPWEPIPVGALPHEVEHSRACVNHPENS